MSYNIGYIYTERMVNFAGVMSRNDIIWGNLIFCKCKRLY